jgi:exonuclease SbcC
MIIKSLSLHNIRSYKDHKPIKFLPGSLLFQGDIGSGKSTILTAIEFALFGLGDIDGRHLLRGKTKEGWVLLEFEVNGKEYKAFRSLVRRRKYVHQGEGYIVENAVRTDYSVTEMKERILDILNFNERPHPKTGSLIFRYAVYTPQEMMKEVLFQRVNRRLETLRRAFGVEDYSIVRNNIDVLRGNLKERITFIRGQTKDLDKKNSDFISEKKQLKKLKKELKELETDFQKVEKELTALEKQIKRLEKKKDRVLKFEAEIGHLQDKIEKGKENLELLEDEIGGLENEKTETTKAEQNLEELKPEYEEFRKTIKKVDRLEKAYKKYQSIKSAMDKLEVAIRKAGESLEKDIKKSEKEVSKLRKEVGKIKPELDQISRLKKERQSLKRKLKKLSSIAKEITWLKQQRSRIETEIDGLKKELKRKRREWKNIQIIGVGAPCPRCHHELTKEHFEKVKEEYREEFGDLKEQIGKLEQQFPKLDEKIGSLEEQQTTLEERRGELTKLEKSIATLEEKKRKVKKTKREITSRVKAIEKDRQKLKKENFALHERKKLTKILQDLKRLEPKKSQFEHLSERLKEFREEEIERLYTENKQIARNKKKILKELSTKRSRFKSLKKELLTNKKKCTVKKEVFDKEKVVLAQIEKLEQSRKNVESAWKSQNTDVAGKKSEIKGQNKRIKELAEEIQEKENLLLKRDLYQQHKIWIDEYFIPTTEEIERHVMASIREEFDELFQRWFNQLIESGDIAVRVDGNFTPLVEQSGYELDVKSLSGGEKTSVALAYRLALNIMVKKVCEAMHSNILILDEPTDGFSNEQLDRVRDILDELRCEQVIMVSHERELEGFVDKIYRVKKEAGISSVLEA